MHAHASDQCHLLERHEDTSLCFVLTLPFPACFAKSRVPLRSPCILRAVDAYS